jgi:uncharacterized protein (TIGR04255 family)
MPFPDSPRAVYKINPLYQVICQLRFPTILRIDTQPPYEFQDLIRVEYPSYSEGKEFFTEIPLEIFSQLPQEVVGNFPLPATNKMNFRFTSADENLSINLTNNYLALTVKKYERWENFRSQLELPVKALIEIYEPAFFSRVGLRYIDVIQRSELNLMDSNWSDLIQPYILGIISTDTLDQSAIKNSITTDEIQINDEQGIVRIVHGLAISKINNESVYLVDCDFFSEKRTEIQDALVKLDNFNLWGRRLFRWCITDFLHNAMQPEFF